MTLKCKIKCIHVYKRSNSPAFKYLQAGDILLVTTSLNGPGRTSHGHNTKAKAVTVKNLSSGYSSTLTFNMLERIMACGDFVEVVE